MDSVIQTSPLIKTKMNNTSEVVARGNRPGDKWTRGGSDCVKCVAYVLLKVLPVAPQLSKKVRCSEG